MRADNPEEIDPHFADIDPNRLDEELLKQPRLMWLFSQQEAQARLDYDNAKNTLEMVTADLELQVRSNPKHFKVDKLTEAVVKAAAMATVEYRSAVEIATYAKYRVAVCAGAVAALEHKKKSLEKLVELHGQNYFSEPKIPTVTREQQQEAVKSTVRKSFKKRDDR